MDSIYDYVHVVRVFLAIMFLGYVFTDLAVISKIKQNFSKEIKEDMTKIQGKVTFKIFPFILLFLVLTGSIMLYRYINPNLGYFDTSLQKILIFKVFLAFIIALGVLSNIYNNLTKQKKSYFMQHHFHKLVITLGFFIVLSAKLMFIV
jgi:hypothetical protein